METINHHISRIILLKLVLRADLYDALGRLRDPADALRELAITIVDSADDFTPECLLRLPLPGLRKLSVIGIPHPGFSWALVPSLRVLDCRGWTLHPGALRHLFERCPHLEELHLYDVRAVAALPGEPDNPEPVAAPHLRVLRLYRVGRELTHAELATTLRALAMLPLRRLAAVALEAMAGAHVLAEAAACLQSAGAVDALEIAHGALDMDWNTASIKATLASGAERSVVLFVPDNEALDLPAFVAVARALGSESSPGRAIKHLALPADCVSPFLRNTDFALGELETLRLTFTADSAYLSSVSPADAEPDRHPPRMPESCPRLRQVILDAPQFAREQSTFSPVRQVLSNMIAFDPVPISATLVLSQSLLDNGVVLDELKSLFKGFAVL